MKNTIRIGSTDSPQGHWRARYTEQQLEAIGLASELFFIKANTLSESIHELGNALLRGAIDVAVHDLKDVPTQRPAGLVITAVSQRANPTDSLLLQKDRIGEGLVLRLPKHAVVGVSSARQKAQLLHIRPDVRFKDIISPFRHMEKIESDDIDAIVFPSADLERMEVVPAEMVRLQLHPQEFVPAPGQGVLAWQSCEEDIATRTIFKKLHHSAVAACTNVERTVLKMLGKDSDTPLGVYCKTDAQGNYHVWAAKAMAWNAPLSVVRQSATTKYQLAEQVVAAFET